MMNQLEQVLLFKVFEHLHHYVQQKLKSLLDNEDEVSLVLQCRNGRHISHVPGLI